jgi:hypothetical protein
MRIVTVEGLFFKHSWSDPYVVKPTWSTYQKAATARAYLKHHFGPMEIKKVEGGYALYTRCISHYASHRSHRKAGRRN